MSDVDELVCAEHPDPNEDPELFQTIMSRMIHGPCGDNYPNAQCTKVAKNGRKMSSKGYPKPYQEETPMDGNGYPIYRRKNDGRRYYHSGQKGDGGFYATNRDVGPHNKFLARKYHCHINIEVTQSRQ